MPDHKTDSSPARGLTRRLSGRHAVIRRSRHGFEIDEESADNSLGGIVMVRMIRWA